jgi:Tfp pilus assembly protein PilX
MKITTMRDQQEGFVAIIVAMFVMLFVTLIALGFAFLVQQNQAQSQNRVLSTQAFYAAESGVNDTVEYLTAQLASTGKLPDNKTNCSQKINGLDGSIGSVNATVKYTCVLFETNPSSLEYTVKNTNSTIVRVEADNNKPLTSITISWKDGDNNNKLFANNGKHLLPQTGFTEDPAKQPNTTTGTLADPNNLSYATDVLRATVIPVYANNITRSSLQTGSQTLFLYPNAGSGTASTNNFLASPTDYNDANQGNFADGNCKDTAQPKYCNVTISNLTSNGGSSVFYLRLRGFYRASSSVTITANTVDGPAKLINEQAIIDATGKAANVLRRIQVRVPLSASSNRPEFAVESTDALCKRLQVWPTGAQISSPLTDGSIPESCRAF